jgi:hypothetical protein
MNRSTVDALADFEQRLSDVLKDVQRARLEFEARLATAVAAEKPIEREHEPQADKLAEKTAEITRKSERVLPLRRPLPSVRPGEPVRRSWWPFRREG